MSSVKFTSDSSDSLQGEGLRGSLQPVLTDRMAVLILIVFSVALYTVTIGYGFAFDDPILLGQNPYLNDFHHLKESFSQDFWAFQGRRARTGYYRPLVMLTLALEKQLFGLQPQYFHFVNILLNALMVVLCYRLGKRLGYTGQGVFWGALLFAALPVHTEVVVPAAGLPDLACGLLMVLAVLVNQRLRDLEGPKAYLAGWLVGGLFLLAVLMKEVALMLPPLLFFFEFSSRERKPSALRYAVARFAPTLILAAAYLLLRYRIFGAIFEIRRGSNPGLVALVRDGLMLLGKYTFVLAWPQHLTCYEHFQPPQSWVNVYVLLGVVSILLGLAAFLHGWKSQRRVCFAVLWIFLTLGPVLNVRFLGVSPYGERYLYIPSVAFCWLAGEGLGKLLERRSLAKGIGRIAAVGFPIFVVAGMAARTAWRLPDWKDELTFDLATVRAAPDSGVYLVRLGNLYRLQGDRRKAREMYVAGIAVDPNADGYLNLGALLMDEGALNAARLFFKLATAADPGFAQAYYGWGSVEMREGNRELAQSLFQRAVELNPAYADALNNLGAMALSQGKLDEAGQWFRRAIQAEPNLVPAHMNLGNLMARLGQTAAAQGEYRRSIQLAPADDGPYLALANLFEQQGRLAEAFQACRKAAKVQPRSSLAEYRLGILALKMGNAEEAVRALEMAAKIQPGSSLVHAELGRAYVAAGATLLARHELALALQLDPQNGTARKILKGLR